MIDNSVLPVNQLIAKLNTAAENSEPLELSVEEVKLASKEFGGLVMIPVYTMDNFPIDKYKRNKNED